MAHLFCHDIISKIAMQLLRLSCVDLSIWFTENLPVFISGNCMYDDLQVDPRVGEFINIYYLFQVFSPESWWKVSHQKEETNEFCKRIKSQIIVFFRRMSRTQLQVAPSSLGREQRGNGVSNNKAVN